MVLFGTWRHLVVAGSPCSQGIDSLPNRPPGNAERLCGFKAVACVSVVRCSVLGQGDILAAEKSLTL